MSYKGGVSGIPNRNKGFLESGGLICLVMRSALEGEACAGNELIRVYLTRLYCLHCVYTRMIRNILDCKIVCKILKNMVPEAGLEPARYC